MKRAFVVIAGPALLVLLAVIASTSLAIAAPAAQTTVAWTASYYPNRNLQGAPTLTRDETSLDFTWGAGVPDVRLTAANFSARWLRWVYIDTPGNWTLTTIHNDGVRLFVDNVLVIDSWNNQAITAHSATLNLTQAFHLVRMEYFSATANAQARLEMISANFPDWRGEYFGDTKVTGTPAFSRNDSAVNFNFNTAGPGGGISGENFAARWSRGLVLAAGRYRFTTLTDDGVRLWVDSQLLIDQWHDQTPKSWYGDITLTTGTHLVKMEYFNHGGAGLAVLTWMPAPGSVEVWHADFFARTGLTGTPALSRDDADINFDWGTRSPGTGISAEGDWAARFTSRRIVTLAGYYTASATADDGVRVWVDNTSLIDEWHDQAPTTHAATIYLNPGPHDWRVEYYQHNGTASLQVQIMPGVTSASPPGGATPSSAVPEVITDDNGTGFFKGGGGEGWRDYPAGYGNHALWAQNSIFSQGQSNWARWYPKLARPGLYEISAFIPGNLATTRNARYWIAHAGTYDIRSLNQALYANQWVSLGTFNFDATGAEYVSIADATYEPALTTVVVIDALRFSPR